MVRRSTSSRRLATVAVVLGVVLTSAVSCAGQQGASESAPPESVETTVPESVETTAPRESVTHEFVIPDGTAARLARREDVDIIPLVLEVRVGDKIQVLNEDSKLARLGLFDVRPGETVSMAFNTPGEMEGVIFSDESGGCGVPPPDVKTFIVNVSA